MEGLDQCPGVGGEEGVRATLMRVVALAEMNKGAGVEEFLLTVEGVTLMEVLITSSRLCRL